MTPGLYTSSSYSYGHTNPGVARTSSYAQSVSRSASRSMANTGGIYKSPSLSYRSPSPSLRKSASIAVGGNYGSSISGYGGYCPPVQSSTPMYMDKYPYVKYSTEPYRPSLDFIPERSAYSLNSRSYSAPPYSYQSSYLPASSYTNFYGSTSRLSRRDNAFNVNRYSYRPPLHSNPVDDALNLYKKRCMTAGSLSKYWLTAPTTHERNYYTPTYVSSYINYGSRSALTTPRFASRYSRY